MKFSGRALLWIAAPILTAACVTQNSIRQLPPTEVGIRSDFARLNRVDYCMNESAGLGWQK